LVTLSDFWLMHWNELLCYDESLCVDDAMVAYDLAGMWERFAQVGGLSSFEWMRHGMA